MRLIGVLSLSLLRIVSKTQAEARQGCAEIKVSMWDHVWQGQGALIAQDIACPEIEHTHPHFYPCIAWLLHQFNHLTEH